ncbi:MAG: hypothetical protein ACI4RA_06800 [Kiritimatiellia bacterium]
MNSRTLVTVAVPSLLCGALLGYFIRPAAPVAATPEVKEERPARKVVKSSTDDAALARLRKRVQDLERQLAEKSAEPVAEEATSEPVEASAARSERRGPPSPEEMRARLEEMRTTDPERYAQMTNRFANMRAHQLQRAQDKLDILASVDVNRLNPRQRQIHEQYQDLIARQEELRNMAFASPDDASVTDEQRRAAHEEMREIGRQLHGVAQQEREILLSQTARSFGVKGDTAREFVETVKAVYQATESRGGGHGGRRPR